jgi:hypothetical protein
MRDDEPRPVWMSPLITHWGRKTEDENRPISYQNRSDFGGFYSVKTYNIMRGFRYSSLCLTGTSKV